MGDLRSVFQVGMDCGFSGRIEHIVLMN